MYADRVNSDEQSSRQAQAQRLQRLIRDTAQRDRAGFAALYRLTSAKLFGVALRILRQREWAEEVLQESFVAIWERAGDYDPARGSAMGWLVTIVRHCAIDQLRRNAARPDASGATQEALSALAAPDSADSRGELRALQRCLDELDAGRGAPCCSPIAMA